MPDPCYDLRMLWLADIERCFLRGGGRFDPLEPNLPPVGISAAGTEHPAWTITSLAHDRVQEDGRVFHAHHLPGLLVDHIVHAVGHPVRLAAVWNQLRVPLQTAVLAG